MEDCWLHDVHCRRLDFKPTEAPNSNLAVSKPKRERERCIYTYIYVYIYISIDFGDLRTPVISMRYLLSQ